MKRLITLLGLALPVLLSSCSDEKDILPEQRQKIVSYLEKTHSPALLPEASVGEDGQLPFYTTAGSTVYRYIDTFREAGFVIKKSGDCIRLDKESPHFKDISQLLHFT